MLNRTDKYALQVLAHLARYPEKRIQGIELAKATHISWTYLSKILSKLRKVGFVTATKGWGGGYTLTKKARGQSIFDVLTAIGGNPKSEFSSCLFGWPKCNGKKPCPLHNDWEKISKRYSDMLKGMTVDKMGRNLK